MYWYFWKTGSYICGDDVCEMLECIMKYSGKQDTFNVSSGRGISQNQIINIVKLMGYTPRIIYKKEKLILKV